MVERLAPIDSAAIPFRALGLEAVLALLAAAFVVVARRDRGWQTVAIAVGIVFVGACIGTSSAFDTIAGSKDCPGSQDCDTVMVPFLMPFALSALIGASLGALVAQLALLTSKVSR
jgi:hypothetical protein